MDCRLPLAHNIKVVLDWTEKTINNVGNLFGFVKFLEEWLHRLDYGFLQQNRVINRVEKLQNTDVRIVIG